MPNRVLIIDDDRSIDEPLSELLRAAGLLVEAVNDGFSAIEKLRERRFCAVILDPMIRHRLNGYAVLNFIEQEQPETLGRLLLLTGMSAETIARTAPHFVSRLFRKPVETLEVVAAILLLADQAEEPRRHGKAVLVVEDDPDTARLMRQLIEELGYDVTLAETGRRALEHLSLTEYAAVFLDLILPDIDGFAVLEHLQKRHSTVLRHLIVVTGMPAEYAGPIGWNQVCAVMRKPVEPSHISQMLHRCEQAWTE